MQAKYGLHARLSTDYYANEFCAINDDGSARVQLTTNPPLKRYFTNCNSGKFCISVPAPIYGVCCTITDL